MATVVDGVPGLDTQTEQNLVEAARSGCVESFGRLYEHYYAPMVWLAYSILLDRDLAEDAAQEAFARACERLVDLRRPDRFGIWLGSICRNEAHQVLRRRKRHRPLDEQAIADDMRVMLHILRKNLTKGHGFIAGVFPDYGDLLGRDRAGLEGLYVQGYGAFLFTEVELADAPGPIPPAGQGIHILTLAMSGRFNRKPPRHSLNAGSGEHDRRHMPLYNR